MTFGEPVAMMVESVPVECLMARLICSSSRRARLPGSWLAADAEEIGPGYLAAARNAQLNWSRRRGDD